MVEGLIFYYAREHSRFHSHTLKTITTVYLYMFIKKKLDRKHEMFINKTNNLFIKEWH